MSIAENIRLLRSWKNISQEELATIAKVTDGSVSNWENGTNEPRMGAIQRIADYYNLKKSDIIEDGAMQAAIEKEKSAQPDELPIIDRKIADVLRNMNDEGKAKLLDYALYINNKHNQE